MKKTITLLLIISMLLATACSNNNDELSNSSNDSEDKITIYTSFYVLYDFASKIGGEYAQVINMIPPGGDPHHWEPTASDIMSLEDGDIFIYNGLSLEHWVDSVLASINNEDLIVLQASSGIESIESHHSHDSHDGHDHGGMDPHIWLDPMRAKIMLENIRDTIIDADLENESYYNDNYEKYAAQLDKLDLDYKENLSDLSYRDIVVSHEAYSYLAQAYDLNQVGIEGLIPDSEPNPARMAEIIDYIRDNQIETIFFEDMNDRKIVDTISSETGVDVEVLYTLEYLTNDQAEKEDDYFSVMRQNLNSLIKGLK